MSCQGISASVSAMGAWAPLLGEWQLMQRLMKTLVASCAAQSAAAASPMASNLIESLRPPTPSRGMREPGKGV